MGWIIRSQTTHSSSSKELHLLSLAEEQLLVVVPPRKLVLHLEELQQLLHLVQRIESFQVSNASHGQQTCPRLLSALAAVRSGSLRLRDQKISQSGPRHTC